MSDLYEVSDESKIIKEEYFLFYFIFYNMT